MQLNQHEERDDIGPLSPDIKRRRFNGDSHQPTVQRVMPPRYTNVHAGTAVGPGTPFPFNQAQNQHPQIYSPASASPASHVRRESLPGLRGVVSAPGPMAPPPRPGPGYQQHRMSQGHVTHDRSLQLPPLQTGHTNGTLPSAKSAPSHSVEEVIMSMPFEAKLAILRKIAPPKALKKDSPRGPLIVIEGDNASAVKDLAKWLSDTLHKDNELNVKLLDGPDVSSESGKDEAMAEYHMLIAGWLGNSKEILKDLHYEANSSPNTAKLTKMDVSSTSSQPDRHVDENYNDDDDTPTKSTSTQTDSIASRSPMKKNSITDIMDVDKIALAKPIAILPLFSLHASNTFACRIPLTDTYAPNDHWSWNATQWRGVIGPDLTIYLKDGEEKGKLVEQSEEEKLFVVRKGTDEVDGATLRRLGFEIGEWVRAFGA